MKTNCIRGHPMSGPGSDIHVYKRNEQKTERICRLCDRIRGTKRPSREPDAKIDWVIVWRLVDGFGPRGTIQERRAAMSHLLDRGISYSEVARRVGVSGRTVERHDKRRKACPG